MEATPTEDNGLDVAADDRNKSVKCRVLYPYADGRYFVNVIQTGGYTHIHENDINFPFPEIEIESHPADRKRIRIVFFGNGHFALPTLKYLIAKGYDVCAVVTMPDKPQGRGKQLKPSAVKEYAQEVGIPVYQPLKLDGYYFRMRLQNLQPTIGVVVEFRILPKCTYGIPKWGTINLHSSLLPQYRGASTIASAIKDGNTQTGVTTFILDEKVDTGNIINNLAVPIYTADSAKDVHDRLKKAGAVMVDDAIQRIAHSCNTVPQNDLICDFISPSYAPKIKRMDCQIPWWKSTREVYDFIRSLSPIPTAWTSLRWLGTETTVNLKIYRAVISHTLKAEHAPGELFIKDGKIYIACGDGVLSIKELQMPNKKRMTAREFLCGYRGIGKGFCVSLPNITDAKSMAYAEYTDAAVQIVDKDKSQ